MISDKKQREIALELLGSGDWKEDTIEAVFNVITDMLDGLGNLDFDKTDSIRGLISALKNEYGD